MRPLEGSKKTLEPPTWAVMCLSESFAYDGGDTPAHQFSCPEWLPRANSYQRALRGSMLEM